MASGDNEMEMDLSLMYADVDDFGQDQEFHDSDLFDDMITSRSNDASDAKLGSHTGRSGGYSGSFSGKKIALYVANLTWWTTDQDLTDAIAGAGVTDLIEIKFNENRANGQSKGFATVMLGSENSCRLLMEKLPKRELHGQTPVVTYATRQALKQFDTQPRKDVQPNGPRIGPPPRGPPGLQQQQGPPPSQFAPPGGFPPQGARLGPPPQPGTVSGPPPPGVPISGITILQAPRPYPSHSLPPPPTGPPILVQTQPGQPPMAMTMAPPRLAVGPPPPGMPPRGPQIVGIRGPPPGAIDPRGPPPTRAEWPRPPEQYQQPPPPMAGFQLHRPPPGGVLLTQHPPPVVAGGPVAVPPPHLHAMPQHSGPPPGHPPAPVPHVNPAFFPSATSAPSNVPGAHQPTVQVSHHTDAYGRPVVSYTPGDAYGQHRAQASSDRSSAQYSSSDNYGRRTSPERSQSGYPGADAFRRGPSPRNDRHEPSASQLSESEFDEILQRNKTVSSTAISRAVQDASAGEFASAIETLVTAISLIKQSKIASDDRCKILISSLQDTLHGIESKSYGSKMTSRDRRSRSRDREREKQSRHRSRSREREYRDRSRDKERHYESERHREKPERSERERSERERERSDRERSDRERSDREREYRESRSSRH